MIYIKCPHCGATLSVPEEYKNDKRLHCSKCEQNFDNTYTPPEKEQLKKSSKTTVSKQTGTNYGQQSNNQELSWKGKILITIIIFIVYSICYITCDGNNADYDTSEFKVKNSEWDGSVYQVKRYLKNTLRDPDSYQSIKWGTVREQNDGSYAVWHKFRAKNAFGGYVIYWMSFTLDSEGNVIDSGILSEE